MRHVLFSLFPNKVEAKAAIAELDQAGIAQEDCKVMVHEDRIDREDLHHAESDAGKGVIKGVVAGVLVGALLGLLLAGPLDLLNVGLAVAAFFGAAAGGLYGFLGGLLTGAGQADSKLKDLALALREGRVLVTTECEGQEKELKLEAIFRRHGAVAAHKGLV